MNSFARQRALATLPLVAALLLILAACDPAPDVSSEDAAATADDAYTADGVETPTRSGEMDDAAGTVDEGAVNESVTAAMVTATAELEARSDSNVSGELTLEQQNGVVRIRGEIEGLTPGLHGMHIHEVGDCSAPDASSAGEHFARDGAVHGAPTQSAGLHHTGDLGNIVATEDGVASVDVIDDALSLSGGESAIGRALVVHSGADDLVSQPAGNSGDRVACGVIERRGSGETTG